MLCQTWTWLAATTPLAATPTLLAANRDHSSHGRSYSYCCRQRPLLLQSYLLFLLPEETTPLAAAPPLVAAGRDYSSCHPDANGVGSEMSGGGAKAGVAVGGVVSVGSKKSRCGRKRSGRCQPGPCLTQHLIGKLANPSHRLVYH